MIRQRVSLAVAGAVVASTALTMGLSTTASAAPTIYDPNFVPTTGDLSGVGSDTSEILLDYITKGVNGIDGFNADKSTGRIASFAAGLDPATVVLKSGSSPVTRPNGSGSGKLTLYGTGNNLDVDFARSSSTLNTAEINANLQQSPFAVDGMKLAVSTTSNAPAGISPAEMVNIYEGVHKTWGEVPGYAGPAPSATIKPLVPQTGSGTYSFFLAQINAAKGSPVVFGSNTAPTQEHDDTLLKNDPNAIAPFSTARAKGLSTIKTLDAAGTFSAKRAIYNVVRQGDLSGSKATLILSAFGPSGFLCSPAAKPLIEAAGFDQLGSATCGIFSQNTTSDFTTSSSVAAATTTTLSATTQNGKSVKLTASVGSAGNLPSGKVVFTENGAKIGQAQVIGGSATVALSNVAVGAHTYNATFNPTNAALFTPSQSTAVSTTVQKTSAISVGSVSKSFGAAANIPVSVTGDGAPAGGSVTVNVGGNVTTVGLANGSASIGVPTTLGAGNYAISVTYNSDGATAGSAVNGSLSISKAGTASSLKLSKKSIKASKKAKVTITVKAPGSSVPATGKVTIKAGKKTVGSGTVKNGKVTINLKKLKKGSYKLKATFAGDANFGGSSTKTVKLKVTK